MAESVHKHVILVDTNIVLHQVDLIHHQCAGRPSIILCALFIKCDGVGVYGHVVSDCEHDSSSDSRAGGQTPQPCSV